MVKTARSRFCEQRCAARKRGVGWELSFEQWQVIWEKSGKWSQRGCRKGQYVMARFGDKGPYAVGNVEIVLCSVNGHDAGKKSTGRIYSAEHNQKTSASVKAGWDAMTPEDRKARGEARRRGEKGANQRVWNSRTPEQRAAIARKISLAKRGLSAEGIT